MKKEFIGKKLIKSVETTTDKTPGGMEILKVTFQDDTVEQFSKVMFDKVIASERCDDTQLRDKRVKAVVEMMLIVLREWGIKVGELPLMSALINQSLNYNNDQALISLVSKYMPRPNSLDDIDLLTVDRILKDAKSA